MQTAAHTAFVAVASKVETVAFVHTTDEAVAAAYGLAKDGGAVVLRDFDSGNVIMRTHSPPTAPQPNLCHPPLKLSRVCAESYGKLRAAPDRPVSSLTVSYCLLNRAATCSPTRRPSIFPIGFLSDEAATYRNRGEGGCRVKRGRRDDERVTRRLYWYSV
jgi:hypothetical protein